MNELPTPSDLAERGFALFPLRPNSKVPAVARDWEHAATTSLVRLRALCGGTQVNLGVACGPSNLVVLDLDVEKGPDPVPGEPTDGWGVLRGLAAGHELPRTFTVSTPSGGRHLYFRPPVDGPAPRNTVRRLGPLIDTRAAGGYVVAPGSRINGVPYRVVDDAPIAPLPEWISGLLHREPRDAQEPLLVGNTLGPIGARLGVAYARTALERACARVESARVGTRNDTLNRAAYSLGTLVGAGLLECGVVEAELTRAARAAGLDARETASTVRSGLTAGVARPRLTVADSGGGGERRARVSASTQQGGGARELAMVGAAAGGGGAGPGAAAPWQGSAAPVGWPARITSARSLDPGARPAAAARLEDTAPLSGLRVGEVAGKGGAADPGGPSGVGGRRPDAVLIPTHEPDPADWPRVFGPQVRLGKISSALRRELLESVPLLALPYAEPDPDVSAAELAERLARLDAAYDRGARAAGPLVGADQWQRIRVLADLLRDLEEELADLAGPLPEQAFLLVRALCASVCTQISVLCAELTSRLALEGLRRSPLWTALRQILRTADAVTTLAARRPASADAAVPRYASARSALQAQLSAMRRDFHGSAPHAA